MAHRNAPTNNDDVIDSRDIIERIDELNTDRAEWIEDGGDRVIGVVPGSDEWLAADIAWSNAHPEEAAELASLEAFAEEAEQYSADWKYGATLIRDSYFRTYAIELAEQTVPNLEAQWPHNCIDWDKAARELQYDYAGTTFDGVTYWIR